MQLVQPRSSHFTDCLSSSNLTSQVIAESFTLDQTPAMLHQAPATFPVNSNQTPAMLHQTPAAFPVNSDQTSLTLDQTTEHQAITLPISSSRSPNKLIKRRRTVPVNKISSTTEVSTTTPNDYAYSMSTTTTLSIGNFLQSETQIAEKTNLHNLLFSYILQKHILHHQSSLEDQKNTTLCEFRSFLVENGEQGIQPPSTVYYMELLNEFPDCAETMSLVAEDLLSKFSNVQGRCS